MVHCVYYNTGEQQRLRQLNQFAWLMCALKDHVFFFNQPVSVTYWLHKCDPSFIQSITRNSITAEIARVGSHYAVQGHCFGTNRKPVCDLLLVNNTNLHHISRTVFELPLRSGQIVFFDGLCLQLTHSFSVTNANIDISHILLNYQILRTAFCYRQYRCIFKYFDLIDLQSYRIQQHYGEKLRQLCRSRSFKVTDFGTNRKPIETSLCHVVQNVFRCLEPFRQGSRV